MVKQERPIHLHAETERHNKRARWLNAWLPVIIGTVMIAISSSNLFSSDNTSGPFRWVFEAIFGPVADRRWHIIHFFIRKGAHFLGYGVYGLLWLRAWWLTLPNTRFFQDAALAILGCCVVASSDEFHQTFLSRRSGSPRDVLLDCTGAATLLMISYIVMRIFRPEKLTHSC